MLQNEFDLHALYVALDDQRRQREMTWAAVTNEVNRHRTTGRPIAQSTITGLQSRRSAEGDGILQMLVWLGRTAESVVPGAVDADAARFRLPTLARGQILRWDTRALFDALNTKRQSRAMTWAQLARELRGFTPGMLTNLAKGGRIEFPRVMRLVAWLDQPAVAFTRIADW